MINIEKIKAKKTTEELLEFGIINIDKPSGPTSFDISDYVRKVLGSRKTSHFGTLDPKVTGVLPIALNRACKLTGFFLGEDKEYVGIMSIHEETPLKTIKDTIKKYFTGNIMQLPPVKSRVKRALREREIMNFEVLEQDGSDYVFRSEVQGGTYIRKLIHDLGEKLGVGAHMLELRRIRAGVFKEEKSHTLYELDEAVKDYENGKEKKLRDMIIPGEVVIELYPVVKIQEEAAERILRGQPVYKKNLDGKTDVEKGERICVFAGDRFIGVFTVLLEGETFAKPDFALQPIK